MEQDMEILKEKIKKMVDDIVPLPQHLKECVEVTNGIPVFRHPLCVMPMYSEMYNGFIIDTIAQKQAYFNQLIEKRDYCHAVGLTERPFRMNTFVDHMHDMSEEVFSSTLAYVWQDAEFPHVNNDIFRILFKKANPEFMMNDDDKKFLVSLPDKVPVYRGTGGKAYEGLSWTTDEEKAIWFSKRFKEPNFLLEACVEKSQIVAAFVGRGESEVVIPTRVTGILTCKV
jgi:hypothetical protein